MLSRSSKTNFTSGRVASTERGRPLQDYTSDVQTHPPAPFPSLEDDDADDEGHPASEHGNQNPENRAEPDLSDLIPESDFHEMFNQFFVMGHEKLLALRSKIRRERGIDKDWLAIAHIEDQKMHLLREHYYQLQVVLFRSPKGRQYDTSL